MVVCLVQRLLDELKPSNPQNAIEIFSAFISSVTDGSNKIVLDKSILYSKW